MNARPSLDLPSIAFFGRTLAEYLQFFALDPAALRGRSVLDVAAGPSSFTAEAVRRGVDAVALDPLYGRPVSTLTKRIATDYARLAGAIRRRPELVRGRSFPSLAAAEASRRRAAQIFLADFPAGLAAGRYLPAALPALPFLDGQFDLVLCAHLLFTYAREFDFAFHLAACRELMRVSRGEVRLHPVVGLDGRVYPGLGRLRRALRADGIGFRLITTGYEFFRGTHRTALLERLPRSG